MNASPCSAGSCGSAQCTGDSDVRGYLEVAAHKDFAAVLGIMRVGGLNMKGVFTRARTPKMAAHVLREFWVS